MFDVWFVSIAADPRNARLLLAAAKPLQAAGASYRENPAQRTGPLLPAASMYSTFLNSGVEVRW
jgi:hypothetical protein